MSATALLIGKIEEKTNLTKINSGLNKVVNFKLCCTITNGSIQYINCSLYGDKSDKFVNEVEPGDTLSCKGEIVVTSWYDKEIKRNLSKTFVRVDSYEVVKDAITEEQIKLVL